MRKTRRLLLTAALLTLLGCGRGEEAAQPTPTKRQTEWDLAGHVQRGKELVHNENDMKQIALLYMEYTTETGRAPATVEDFIKYIQRDARKLVERLQDGRYVLVPNVANLGSHTAVAYEKDVDLNGNRIVAFGDSSVRLVGEAEFQTLVRK